MLNLQVGILTPAWTGADVLLGEEICSTQHKKNTLMRPAVLPQGKLSWIFSEGSVKVNNSGTLPENVKCS